MPRMLGNARLVERNGCDSAVGAIARAPFLLLHRPPID